MSPETLFLACFSIESVVYWMTHSDSYLCVNIVGSTCLCKGDLPTPYCRKETVGCDTYAAGKRVSGLPDQTVDSHADVDRPVCDLSVLLARVHARFLLVVLV